MKIRRIAIEKSFGKIATRIGLRGEASLKDLEEIYSDNGAFLGIVDKAISATGKRVDRGLGQLRFKIGEE